MQDDVIDPRSATRPAGWEAFLKEGRRIVAQQSGATWELGDLAIKVAPIGTPSKRSGAYEVLREFAHQIGIDFETLRGCLETAHSWQPEQRRPNVSWSVHHLLLYFDGRFDLLRSRQQWSYREAQNSLRPITRNEITHKRFRTK